MSRFSDTLMEHFTSPRNTGHMESPDMIGAAGTAGNGPFVVLYLRVKGEAIMEAKYQSHGCGATIAAGSMLTELVRGRTVQECFSLTAEGLIEALGGVPPDKLHSPALAIGALRAALAGYAGQARG